MEPEDSLPCSKEPATGLCPELDASSPHLPSLFHQWNWICKKQSMDFILESCLW